MTTGIQRYRYQLIKGQFALPRRTFLEKYQGTFKESKQSYI
jgi:hypothetical protein